MFDSLDALLLARSQFAFTVSFHFLFPAFSIGLARYLMVLEGLLLATGPASLFTSTCPVAYRPARIWRKVGTSPSKPIDTPRWRNNSAMEVDSGPTGMSINACR